MWNILAGGIIVATITAWDKNDALVFAHRSFGPFATVERAA
jgi:hypothetical protein